MSMRKWSKRCVIVGIALAVLSGNGIVRAEVTKQLKKPAAPKVVVEDKKAPEKEKSPPATDEKEKAPQLSGSESYSIVIENKTGPDGKRIRTKKVWKNGALVEDRQDVVEGNGPDADASVILSDGETAPGMILRSERFGEEPFDPLGDMSVSPSEMIRRFEQQFRRRQQEQARRMEEIRRQHGIPGGNAHSVVAMPQPSEYWIGASIMPVPEILAAQLDLPEGKGALVVTVVPDSPAAKAGIKKYDILVKAGKTEINDLTAIGKLLDQEKGKEQVFDVYRKGKMIKVNIKPEKRPSSPEEITLAPEDDETERSQIRVVRPGIIVPGDKTKKDAPAGKTEDVKKEASAPEKPKS